MSFIIPPSHISLFEHKEKTRCCVQLYFNQVLTIPAIHVIKGYKKYQYKVKFQTDQNKICRYNMRYILDYHSRKNIGYADFCKLGWLNVSSRVDYLALNLMYGVSNQNAPSYLCNMLCTTMFNLVIHSQSTKHSNFCFTILDVKTKGSPSFKFCGIKLWNMHICVLLM